jgi:hypothetical protein
VFDRLTDRARDVLSLARVEAEISRSTSVGTEHLLLALLNPSSGAASALLRSLGLVLTDARTLVPAGGNEVVGRETDWTPAARMALNQAAREAVKMLQSHITPEHILIGVIAHKDSDSARVIFQSLPNSDAAIEDLLRKLHQTAARADGEQPEVLYGTPVPLKAALARTPTVIADLETFLAYRDRISFDIRVRAVHRGALPELRLENPGHWLRDTAPTFETFSLRVVLPDGQTVTTLTHPKQQFLAGRPSLSLITYSASEFHCTLTYVLSPMPPEGPMTFICEWPAGGINSSIELPSAPIRAASDPT